MKITTKIAYLERLLNKYLPQLKITNLVLLIENKTSYIS